MRFNRPETDPHKRELARQLALAERLIIMSARAGAYEYGENLSLSRPKSGWRSPKPTPITQLSPNQQASRTLLAIPELLTASSHSTYKSILKDEVGNPSMLDATTTFSKLGLLSLKPARLSPIIAEYHEPLYNTIYAARYPAQARSFGPRLEAFVDGDEREYLIRFQTLGAVAISDISSTKLETSALAVEKILYDAAAMNLAIQQT